MNTTCTMIILPWRNPDINFKKNVLFYSGQADCGVFGGWPYLAYQYIMKAVRFHYMRN